MGRVIATIKINDPETGVHFFTKNLDLDFSPLIGDVVRPISPYASESPIPVLELNIRERYFNHHGRLEILFDPIRIDPSYEYAESMAVKNELFKPWSSAMGDIIELLEYSDWNDLGDER